jgi:EAL domain-containing protein (putative c-di-GMP-specific phosphodiesterase class I)
MLSPDIFVSVSVGIAVWPGSGGNSPEDLLRSADIAMHEAKSRGKAQCALYSSGMDARAKQRLRHESELRRAFEHSELSVYYQPLVNIRGGGIYGFEALLRWIHPKRGVISPGEFIPLAEETGLIVPIGRWVLEQACQQVRVWHAREPQRPLLLSVNLSPRQFKNPLLVDEISQCLKTTGFPPYQLQLEITESTGFEEMASANATLWRLKDLGVRIALDDFGTGYSALGYLKHYPVDTIKLDRSFVQGLGHNSQDTAIIHAVVAFARALSLSITAEGIETAEQLDHLNRLGCEYGQGYYFARPVPADRAAAMLSASTSSGDLSLLASVPGSVSSPLP